MPRNHLIAMTVIASFAALLTIGAARAEGDNLLTTTTNGAGDVAGGAAEGAGNVAGSVTRATGDAIGGPAATAGEVAGTAAETAGTVAKKAVKFSTDILDSIF